MPDLATRALFDRGRIYIPEPADWSGIAMRSVHKPGRWEQRWEAEVRDGKTCLTFEGWMRTKGLR